MPAEIVEVYGIYSSARVKLTTSDERAFWLILTKDGLHFHSDVNRAGTPNKDPVVKSADDLLDWIKGEGSRKRFIDRVGLKPRRKAGTAAPIVHQKLVIGTKTKV